MNWLLELYNGGLDPRTTDHRTLRETRSVSVASLVAALGSILVLARNALEGNWAEVPLIATLIPIGPLTLFLLHKVGKPSLTGQPLVAALVLIVTVTMGDSGLTGMGWIWLSAVPLLSTLMTGRTSGLVWTVVSTAVVVVYLSLHLVGVEFPNDRGGPWWMVGPQLSFFILGFGALVQGLTVAQERAERAMEEQLDRLRSEVETRRAAEQRAKEAARVAREAELTKDQFLATVSHELRTPMNGVLGAASLMRHGRLDAEQRDLLQTIQSSGQLLLTLVDDVLDFSRMESGLSSLERVPVDLPALVREVARPLAFNASERGIAVRVEIDPGMPRWFEGDPTRLRQILLNLAGNAAKFTSQGHVIIRARYKRERVRLQVEDTGIGIESDALDRIFEPFVQAEASTVRRFGGTGLGLSIVKGFVELMRGTIRVESKVGRGSTFTVELPLEPCAGVEDPPGLETTARRLRPVDPSGLADGSFSPDVRPERFDDEPSVSDEDVGDPDTPSTERPQLFDASRRVLLVDDNAVNRLVARKMLEKLGHVVVEATNGVDAIERADGDFDLVLMDVQMPEMDGLEATRVLLASEATSHLPIVGLSANLRTRDKERGIEAGMCDYLGKPVTSEALQQALERFAPTRRAERAAGQRFG